MPNYFFTCKRDHLFEAIVPYETMLKGIPCRNKSCRCKAKMIPMSRGEARAARHFAPSLLYVRADGEIVAPGRNNPDHLPKSYRNSLRKQGYKEVQITNFREYEKFQRDIGERLQARAEAYNAAEQRAYDQAVKEQIDSLRRGGYVTMPNEHGQGERVINMPPLDKLDHPEVRRFAQYAIERMKNYKFKTESPNPYINAFENDGIRYEDRDTDYKKRS